MLGATVALCYIGSSRCLYLLLQVAVCFSLSGSVSWPCLRDDGVVLTTIGLVWPIY